MFPLLIPAAIGAVGGALMNKKKPLKGALLGAGLGAAGGAAAPALGGLLGGGAAAGSAAGAASAAPGFAIGQPLVSGGLGSATMAGGSAAAPAAGLLGTVNSYIPAFNAAATGVQMSGALDEQPMPEAPPPMQVQGGAETLAGIASQTPAAQMQGDQTERARRRAMLRGGV